MQSLDNIEGKNLKCELSKLIDILHSPTLLFYNHY